MAPTQTLSVKTRGLVFAVLEDWLRDKLDDEEAAELRKSLPADTCEFLDAVKKGAWYPLERLLEALTVCAAHSGNPRDSWMDFGSYLCKVSLTTSFKGLIAYIDTVTFMRRLPIFFRRYFNGGDMRAEEVSGKQAVVSLQLPGGGEVLATVLAGWLRQALEMIGLQVVDIQTQEIPSRLRVSWA